MSVVPENLRPTYSEKTVHAMKAERAVKRITFNPFEASPGNSLYVYVPKLNENEVLVPGSLALVFDIDLSGGHANNFLVQNVTRVLVDRLVVKFAGTTLQGPVRVQHLQNFRRHFPFAGRARQQDSRRDSERGSVQDPLRRGRQENLGR